MRYTFMFCILFGVVGCGSGGAGTSGPDPAEECQTFVEAQFCPKVETCAGVAHADCVGEISTVVDCGKATSVSPDLSRCERDLAALTCPIFWDGTDYHMPAVCMHLFGISE